MKTGVMAVAFGGAIAAAAAGAAAMRAPSGGADPAALAAVERGHADLGEQQRALEARLGAALRRADQLALGLEQAYRTIADLRREQEEQRALIDDLLGFGGAPPASPRPAAPPSAEVGDDTSVAALDPFGRRGAEAYARSPDDLLAAAARVPPEREQEILAVLAKAKAEEERRERERDEERRQQRARGMVEGLSERLGLAPDQVDAMAAVLHQRDQSRAALMGGRGGPEGDAASREARRAQMEAIDQAYEASLQELLTPAQYDALKAVRQEWQGGGPGGEGRMRRQGGPG